MIRVVITDDQDLVRAGLRMIIESAGDLTVVGEAADGEAALVLVTEHCPDIVLMDIRMPRLDGIQSTRRLNERANPPRVLMLTTFDSDDVVYAALHAGASGFLLKTAPPARLIDAIRCIHAGEALLAPSITKRLIETHLDRGQPDPEQTRRLETLTAREREVLTLIGRGLSNDAIAGELTVTEATVKTHVNRLFAKLAVRDRVQAVVLSYETGLVRVGQAAQAREGSE